MLFKMFLVENEKHKGMEFYVVNVAYYRCSTLR